MTTIARTDIHRPSAPEFDPEAYELVGVYDLCDTDAGNSIGPTEAQEFGYAIERLAARGVEAASHAFWGCGHCGQSPLRYAALLFRPDMPEAGWITVGQTCLSNRFRDMTAADFKAVMARAAESRAAQKLIEAERAFLADKPALAAALQATVVDADLYDAGYELFTIRDIARKLRRYGSISEKQGAFVCKLATQIVDRTAEARVKLAEKAAAPALPPVTLGKGLIIEGVATEPKFVDNEFGGKWTMLVVLDDGTKVWGTVPSAIFDETHRGTRVRFVANVEEASWSDDASFAKFSRPRKAVVISQPEA